ncbi:MAG: potassium channel family protein [Jatrophihabitans sp.]
MLDRHLSHGGGTALAVVELVVWVAFAADFAARLWLARRWRYLWTHLHDLAMIALPALRPLRLVRLLMLLRLLNRRGADSLRGRVVLYVAGSAAILLFCASLAILDAERGRAEANIETFGDALWWATATVSTVGYGDRYPVTTEGRFVAAGLMIGGIALIGVVTATFASWLIDRVRDVADEEQAATRADLEALRAELAALRTLLANSVSGSNGVRSGEAAERDVTAG